MNRTEFKTWADDLKAKLPETGEWVFTLTEVTRDVWFDDVFSHLSLDNCLAANSRLMAEGLKKYDRERLPAIVAKHAQEVAFEETQRNAARAEPKDRRRYDCTGCLDSGYVSGRDNTRNGQPMAAACNCAKGDVIKSGWDAKRRQRLHQIPSRETSFDDWNDA